MGDRSYGARPPRRPILLAIAIVALLGLVALASRAHAPGGGGSTHRVNTDLLIEYVLLFIAAGTVVVVPLVIWVFVTERRRKPALGARSNWMVRLLVVMVLFSIALAVSIRIGFHLFASHGGRSGTGGGGTPPYNRVSAKSAHNHIRLDWAPAVVIGSLLLAAALVGWAVYVHRRRSLPRTQEAIAADLSDVLDDTLDDLRAESDPRRAVIAAYARMERALAWFGLPRRVFEAPLEYLSRVLLELQASAESVRRLTGLFERAKFSTHEIGPSVKEDAIQALVTVRDELRAFR